MSYSGELLCVGVSRKLTVHIVKVGLINLVGSFYTARLLRLPGV